MNNEQDLAKLWLVGVAAWGPKWVKAMGEIHLDETGKPSINARLWATLFKDFTPNVVMAAMAAMATKQTFSPSYSEITEACKAHKAEQLRINPPDTSNPGHRYYKAAVSARSAANESVADNCRAFNARAKAYGFEYRDHAHP